MLVAPYRAQPSFTFGSARRGSGSVAGLGYFVSKPTVDGEPASAFLGVFAHFQVLLIELRSLAIANQQPVAVGTAYPATDAPDKTAWNALTMPRKIAALQELTQDEIRRLIPVMVGSRER